MCAYDDDDDDDDDDEMMMKKKIDDEGNGDGADDVRQCQHTMDNLWLHRLISIYAFGWYISVPEVLRYCVCVCLLSVYVKVVNEELKFVIYFLVKN